MTSTVAHVNVSRGYRGGERQTELLIRELTNCNVHQVLVTRQGEPLAQRLQGVNVEVREISGYPTAVAMATGGVDLVHVHEGRSVYGAYLRSLISGTPYIVTRRIDNPFGNSWLTHKAYRRATFVVAVAPQISDIIGRYDHSIRSRVIHSASSGLQVDDAQSSAIRNGFPGKFLVGHVGALDNKQKGQEYIIQVAETLRHSHPDIQFLLVGGGDDEAMLRIAASGLSNVTFTGFVNNVGDYLAAFDIFILPSNKEGIGSIVLDAMERGLAVIASRVGGVPEIVRNGENGILIDQAQPDQLAAAVLRLRDSPELRHRLGKRGLDIAKSFPASVMCEKYLNLYRDVLGAAD